jgi:hypothetical protein
LIKLGVDTHAGRYVLARMVDNQNAQPPQAMTPEAFLAYLEKQKNLAARVVMVYEAGPYGFSLYRQATALGVECLVCAPERLSRGRKRVNDKIDARELLSRLDRHLSGNTTALRLVRAPTLDQHLPQGASAMDRTGTEPAAQPGRRPARPLVGVRPQHGTAPADRPALWRGDRGPGVG